MEIVFCHYAAQMLELTAHQCQIYPVESLNNMLKTAFSPTAFTTL